MKNRFVLGAIMVAVAVFVGVSNVDAAKKSSKSGGQQVTHGELAKLLTPILFIEVAGTNPKDHMKALSLNNIAPLDGWPEDASEVVKKADLAVVIGQAMALLNGWFSDGSEPPTTANGWIKLLKEMGVPIGSVGQAADNLSPLAQAVQPGQATHTVDPYATRKTVDLPLGSQLGAEIPASPRPRSEMFITLADVQQIITTTPTPKKKKKVTED